MIHASGVGGSLRIKGVRVLQSRAWTTTSQSHTTSSSITSASQFVFYYNDMYKVDLPEKHKFPMGKYALVREQLQERLSMMSSDVAADAEVDVTFRVSPLVTVEELQTTHCPIYISRFLQGNTTPAEQRVVGFPWSQQGVLRSLSSVGGTLAAARHVIELSINSKAKVLDGEEKKEEKENNSFVAAAHLAGGTHHSFYDRGEGFCVFSDIAVAANCIMQEYTFIEKILIIDLDVHQGNGNASLFADDPRVITFNMHCTGNIFSELEQSDIDVELPTGCNGEEYLSNLQHWMPYLFEVVRPQLVFFQAGVDVLSTDRLGKLNLSRNDLRKRNSCVYSAAAEHAIPLVVTMGGGYPANLDPSSESFRDTIGGHVDVYEQVVSEWRKRRGAIGDKGEIA